jgi:hypothetical protein
MQPDQIDIKIGQAALQEIREAVEGTGEFPMVDLFKEYS